MDACSTINELLLQVILAAQWFYTLSHCTP